MSNAHGGDDHGHDEGHTRDVPAEQTTLSVPSMDCASCADKVTGGLESVPGVTRIDANPTTGTVEVDHEAGTTLADLERAVERAGYDVTDADDGDERSGTSTSTPALATYVARTPNPAGLLLANPLTPAPGPTA